MRKRNKLTVTLLILCAISLVSVIPLKNLIIGKGVNNPATNTFLAESSKTEGLVDFVNVTYDALFESALLVIEDPSANPCHRAIMIKAAVNYWLHDWQGILPNETLPPTVESFNTFLDRGSRLLYALNDIQTEPVGDYDPIQEKDLIEVVVLAIVFIQNIVNITVNVVLNPGFPVWIWLWVWDPYVSHTPEDLALSGYVTRSSAFVVVKETEGLAYRVVYRWMYFPGIGWANIRTIDFVPAEFIKTITYEYVYDPVAQSWEIQKTVDTQIMYKEELKDYCWFYPVAKDP